MDRRKIGNKKMAMVRVDEPLVLGYKISIKDEESAKRKDPELDLGYVVRDSESTENAKGIGGKLCGNNSV